MIEHQNLQPALSKIAEYFKATQAEEIKLQCDDVVISVKYGGTLDDLQHEHTFAIYVSEGIKECVDCGLKMPLFDLEIKHHRDNGY